jgi:hypothetical protein
MRLMSLFLKSLAATRDPKAMPNWCDTGRAGGLWQGGVRMVLGIPFLSVCDGFGQVTGQGRGSV